MTHPVIIGVLVAAFSSMLTFIFTTLVHRSVFGKMADKVFSASQDFAKSVIKHHEEVWHQDSMYEYVESKLRTHEVNCDATEHFRKINKALYAIYTKQGGDVKDLDI